jgi:hypothetical protein
MSSNVVVLGKAGTNETYIPFSLNDGGVLYTDQAPNSNAGIIQGRDLNLGGVDFGVVLDGMGTNLNALPTVSRMYATNPITGAITPVGINGDGELIVSGGGGGGGGGIVQGKNIATGLGVDITAEVNALSGINSLYSHSSIFGKDPVSELEKQIEVNTEGQISVLVKNASLPVNVSDGAGLPLSSTVQVVGTGTANFLNTYSRMVGTSNGTDYKLALMDSGGRLATLTNLRDGNGSAINSVSVGTQRGLCVVDINQSYSNTGIVSGLNTINYQLPPSGSFGNVANNTTLLTEGETSIFTLVGNFYKEKCILTVEDTSITSTGYYIIQASSDGTNYENLGIIQPISYITGKRGNSTILNLSPYTNLKLINGSGDTYNNVKISIYLSK